MEGWGMEGPIDLEDVLGPSYAGRKATKITAKQELENMYMSRFEVTADNLTAIGMVAYVTYVKSDVVLGDIRLTSYWTGENEIPDQTLHYMLGETPKVENLRLHLVYMDADEVELKNFRIVQHCVSYLWRTRLEGWWMESDYHQEKYVIKQTSENLAITDPWWSQINMHKGQRV